MSEGENMKYLVNYKLYLSIISMSIYVMWWFVVYRIAGIFHGGVFFAFFAVERYPR